MNHYSSEDSWLDEDDDAEDPSIEDQQRFSGVTTICPECRSEIYDDVVVCPICGHLLSEPRNQLPPWKLFLIILLILIISGVIFIWLGVLG